MTVETVQANDFLILVDNLDGLRAYRVTHFEVDIRLAVLRPVFDEGKTLRDFSSMASFRLVAPGIGPNWMYESALHRLTDTQEDTTMADPKVSIPKGSTTNDGRVSFKSGARPGPAGSGQARNDRLSK